MRELGILIYTPELSSKIDGLVELAYSSEEEIEIRACTVIAVEKII